MFATNGREHGLRGSLWDVRSQAATTARRKALLGATSQKRIEPIIVHPRHLGDALAIPTLLTLAPRGYHAAPSRREEAIPMTVRLKALCVLLVLVGTVLVPVRAADTVFLEELTWTELKDQMQAGKTIVIVPIGGTEQNGPAMVLGKHNLRAKTLAGKIALALGNALVAPVIAYAPEGGISPPTGHMRLPGTITVTDDAFQKTLEYAARSFKLHGFRDVVLLGDHGGYQKSLKTVANRLNHEWRNTPVRVHAIEEYYRAAASGFAQELRHRGYKDSEIGTHAGFADTSLALATDPKLVRAERLASGADLDAAHGVYGDPRRASAELGEAGVELIVNQTVEAIRKAVARH